MSYAGEAVVESMWLVTTAPRDEVCRDCWSTVVRKGERQHIMVAALSYEPNAKPIRCEKPVCQTCFEMRKKPPWANATAGERVMEKRELPILFKGEMVRAILEDHKTQTRRVIKPQPSEGVLRPIPHGTMEYPKWGQPIAGYLCGFDGIKDLQGSGRLKPWRCPYGKPGDHLWVRETFCPLDSDHWTPGMDKPLDRIAYKASCDDVSGDSERCRKELGYKWRPSIFMPRFASRLTLVVTDVRVERVQEISEEDAQAEGCDVGCRKPDCDCARQKFAELWNLINGKRGFGWEANPWVWAVTFARAKNV